MYVLSTQDILLPMQDGRVNRLYVRTSIRNQEQMLVQNITWILKADRGTDDSM